MFFQLVMCLFCLGPRPRANGPVFLPAAAQTSLSDKTLAVKNTTALHLTWKKADARRRLGVETREYRAEEPRSTAPEQGITVGPRIQWERVPPPTPLADPAERAQGNSRWQSNHSQSSLGLPNKRAGTGG